MSKTGTSYAVLENPSLFEDCIAYYGNDNRHTFYFFQYASYEIEAKKLIQNN